MSYEQRLEGWKPIHYSKEDLRGDLSETYTILISKEKINSEQTMIPKNNNYRFVRSQFETVQRVLDCGYKETFSSQRIVAHSDKLTGYHF